VHHIALVGNPGNADPWNKVSDIGEEEVGVVIHAHLKSQP
jgi:hypothetical protein